MPEYIEREALFQKVLQEKKFVFRTEDLLNDEVIFRTVYGDFAEFVNSIPTEVNVVNVVRCVDCKYCEVAKPNEEDIKEAAITDYICKADNCRKYANDYCSYGKREEGAEE